MWSRVVEVNDKIRILIEEVKEGGYSVSVYSRRKAKNPQQWKQIDSLPYVREQDEALRIASFVHSVIDGVTK